MPCHECRSGVARQSARIMIAPHDSVMTLTIGVQRLA
jgi:hypothetical protein